MRDVLCACDVGVDVVEAAELATSEVVTNLVIHVRATGELLVSVDDGVVRVEVVDHDARRPTVRAIPDGAVSGRGLHIVQAVSRVWGVEDIPGNGKSVWFELG